jgi:hypothetical protein
MALAPDSGGPFDLDVSRVDQSSYAFLTGGGAVTLVKVVSLVDKCTGVKKTARICNMWATNAA